MPNAQPLAVCDGRGAYSPSRRRGGRWRRPTTHPPSGAGRVGPSGEYSSSKGRRQGASRPQGHILAPDWPQGHILTPDWPQGHILTPDWPIWPP
eukprot:955166-Prorocentrum_minimum.AAC.1